MWDSVAMSKDPFAVRGHRAYSSMTSPPPMDRVTRQTSRPFDPQDVVIGIPQPYRTSFSAVTPPQRMSRHVVTHSPPATKTKSQDVLVKRVAMSTDSILDEAEESPRSNFQRLNVRYASTPSHIYSSNKKQQYRDACDSGLQSSCDDVFSDNASVSSDDRLVREFMGQEVKTPADPSIREEPQVKMMITKEYVHQTTVNYSDIIGDHIPESSLKSDQIVLDMLRLKGLLPNSQNKSCTLPVTAPSRDSNAKRSLSTSIGNFFKKMSPKTLRKSRRDMAKQSKEGKTLPAESQRLLKSIEKNSPANGEVYSSFKKRTQSPHSIEASAMKPQALKAVEFPDNLLSPDYHGNGPPKSLNVRQVAEMEKRVFKFPSVSVESIGQCSLDVQQPAGSEPSLVNHAPSSTPASKRTLTSHDPQPANGSVDNLDHSVDSEAKSPSYVKLSCAVSGYSSNKYNAFNSEDKVKKTKPPLPHKPAPLRGASRTNGSDATSVSLVSVTVDTDETDSCRVNGTSPRTPLVNGQRPQQHDNDVPTPQKDGSHFLVVVQKESDRLHELCAKAELYLEAEDLPEEASGRIRATIGKANLLTSKKFKQFRGLCQKNLEQADDEPFQTTAQDLAGFWDMVLTQVDDLDCKFAEIESLRSNGWISRNASSASLNNIEKSSNKAKHSGTKNKSCRQPSVACTPKSSLSASARAHRDEARRRLLQAKRAGRQRKVSQSDNKDDVEVEIFVPQ